MFYKSTTSQIFRVAMLKYSLIFGILSAQRCIVNMVICSTCFGFDLQICREHKILLESSDDLI